MKSFGLWIRKYWWIVVAVGATVVGFVLGGGFRKKRPDAGPSLADMANQEAEALQERIDVKKAAAKAKTDEKKEELKEIEVINNDVERRKRLAAFIEGL